MAINYAINSCVIDITRDHPQPGDVLLVDTNVWYWQTYTRASSLSSSPAAYQTKFYPNYIDLAIDAGSTLLRSAHSLVELSGLVEKDSSLINVPRTQKEFRHAGDAVTASYHAELESIWYQIKSITHPVSQLLDDALCSSFVSTAISERLDGYDSLLLLLARERNVTGIITDDGDFSTVSGITVHTANQRVLSAASRKGKLAPCRNRFSRV